MGHYKHHMFFCCNQREDGDRPSCQENDADHFRDYVKKKIKAEGLAGELQTYAKERIAKLGLKGKGKVRINKAGCLDRCELGPVAVVYPDETWYTYIDESDLDEIIESHLKNGQPVERLKI